MTHETEQTKSPAAPTAAGDARRRRWSRLLRADDGVAMTELALSLPLLLVLLLGMIDFGKAINYWIDETHLANMGARWAVVNKNPGDPGNTGIGSPNLQAYILSQADTDELKGTTPGTQQSAHSATVNVCFYRSSDGALTTAPIVGDTVKVTVRYRYDWSRFLLGQLPVIGRVFSQTATTIGSSSTMRLETIPTHYSSAENTGPACPSAA